ncbi:hypothetical protein RintRC_5809 [Richelia intracellularis]|nr:hypothetical protein RintRC_5809 [Richelia intracellularis]
MFLSPGVISEVSLSPDTILDFRFRIELATQNAKTSLPNR